MPAAQSQAAPYDACERQARTIACLRRSYQEVATSNGSSERWYSSSNEEPGGSLLSS